MKQVIFLRHAKAFPSGGEPDHDRALDPRGHAEAARAGQAIGATWQVDLACVSDARRTRETYAAASPFLRPTPVLRLERALYDAAPATLLGLLRTAPAEAGCVLLVGHNPGIGDAARQVTTVGAPEALAQMREGFPTASFAVVRFEAGEWRDVVAGGGTLEAFIRPDRTGNL